MASTPSGEPSTSRHAQQHSQAPARHAQRRSQAPSPARQTAQPGRQPGAQRDNTCAARHTARRSNSVQPGSSQAHSARRCSQVSQAHPHKQQRASAKGTTRSRGASPAATLSAADGRSPAGTAEQQPAGSCNRHQMAPPSGGASPSRGKGGTATRLHNELVCEANQSLGATAGRQPKRLHGCTFFRLFNVSLATCSFHLKKLQASRDELNPEIRRIRASVFHDRPPHPTRETGLVRRLADP